jgi:S1-C subfamily serine protease
MKLLKISSVLVTMAGLAALGAVAAPPLLDRLDAPLAAQERRGDPPAGQPLDRPRRQALPMFGAGSHIGASVRDLEPAEADRHTLTGGAVVEEVQPDSPASRAGLRRSDIIVVFDGEPVRSVRQFARLVQETPAGRTVTATIVRDGQRSDVRLTPSEGGGPGVFFDGDRLRERLGDLAARLPEWDFRVDVDPRGTQPRGRHGVTIAPLTEQLAAYFGAKEGVLVTAVVEGSAAEKAGVRAGDVITSVDGSPVRSPVDLTRALRDRAGDTEITLGLVRDRKELSLKAGLGAAQQSQRAAPPRQV